MKQIKNSYDLEERTAKFGENIILFCRTLKPDVVSRPIIGQVVRSGTSIGANYMGRLTPLAQKEISRIRSTFVKRKLKRPNIG